MELIKLETNEFILECEDATIESRVDGYCMEFKIVAYRGKLTQKEVKKSVKIPELYQENLDALSNALREFEGIETSGLFDLELRVKIDDVECWAVIGYGESGDPCILRFE